MKNLAIISLLVSVVSTSAAIGHEFWISPQDYTVEADEKLVAHLRIGQGFVGASYAYIPVNFARFDLVSGDEVIEVKGNIGDRPALSTLVPHEGLWVVVHETTDNTLTYQEWEKFTGFVEHKDLGDTLAQHAERGLPQTGFSERYRRFAKSLIAVGNGEGADREVGLRTEIVAEVNPYTDNLSNGLPVRVLFEGVPRQNVQIEIFDRDLGGDVTTTTTRTDGDGRAVIPVNKGHEYLIDAVVMLPLEAGDPPNGPVWESLWAGLTFQVPK